ncbi:MAG TPA: sensor histidine kinase [Solirubrobacterales bacterium]|jgi:two-component system sensor histidine kinase UhpB|nr:sensor histidine kinase [Solirubrobacterales bacterium]
MPIDDNQRWTTIMRPPSEPSKRLPLLWRAYIGSALIMVGAALLLILSPVTIHAPISFTQLVLVLGALAVMLLLNLWSLRRVLAPLHRLTGVMGKIDPNQPGERIIDLGSNGPDVAALTNAFNKMLDRLEAERQESARVALAAQESERQRLAAELHDEIGQTLTGAAIQIEHSADAGADSPTDLRQVAGRVRETLDEVRRISRELRPEALDDLGLVNALISLCSRVARQSEIRIERQLERVPGLTPELELVIYRVAQESLTNVIRHAEASEATVSLRGHGQTVILSIADDGRGLPTPMPVQTAGLSGMRERARLVQGRLAIESKPGAGTVVRLEAPIGEIDAGTP